MTTVRIGHIPVGEGHPCFVIAEIGINHNGSLDIAKQCIAVAVESGCQAVKFQKRTVDTVYTPAELATPRAVHPSFMAHARMRQDMFGYDVLSADAWKRLEENPDATTNGDLKRALEFGAPEYSAIDDFCTDKGILWSASPWDEASVEFLSDYNPPFFKIGSASLTDAGLLKKVQKTGKPIVLSTGMSTLEQVRKAVTLLEGSPLILLHCVSTYPTNDVDLNLGVIDTLRKQFPKIPIGYSGHERGTTLSACAVALGAVMVERHITLDRSMPGSDQSASLEPAGLSLMVSKIRRFETAKGNGVKTVIPDEVPIAKKLRRVNDF